MNLQFEWDSQKANVNLNKHGIRFKKAKAVFRDPLAYIFDYRLIVWISSQFNIIIKNSNHFMKVREVVKRLKTDGWYEARIKGSHRVFKHPTKLGIVVVPGNFGDDVAIGTLKSIWKQAELED
jgi:predicted RNA binding protein YcfA (HicA-like mRNA interferase family)